MRVKLPWTAEQIFNLWEWQRCGHSHPFTCANRGDGKHKHRWGDLGVLVPSFDGWVCVDCDYTQDWAHDFMLNEPAPKPGLVLAQAWTGRKK